MADAHPARAVFFRFFHGDLIRLRPYHQAQAVISIDGRHARFFPDNFYIGSGIDSPQREHVKIAMKPRHAVGVDTSQIAPGQHIRGLPGIGRRHTEMHEHFGAEILEVINRENVEFLIVGHGRQVAAPTAIASLRVNAPL